MIVLIIIIAVSSIGWLYILCRSLNRFAALSDKLISLTLFGGLFLFLTPFLFIFLYYKFSFCTLGLFSINWQEIDNLSLLFILTGILAFVGEIVRRKITKKLKAISINNYCRLQSTKNVNCINCLSGEKFWKYVYKIASLIPGNKINILHLHNYKINIPGNTNKKIRIVHLTDIHFVKKISDSYYKKIVTAVNECKADLILLTGDFLQNPDTVLDFKPIFSKFKAKSGVFFVCGNHDIWHYEKPTAKMLEEIGFVHLDGKVKSVEINGEKVCIAGTEQPWIKDNIKTQLTKLPDNSFVILLSHTPDNINRIPLRNVKLILSGHTHGGQNALPGLGPLIVPSRHGSAYASGFIKVKKSLLYISRGVALHHPLRIMCPLEIVCIDI